MTSVYFDPALGGDGSTVSDDADPTTGLKKGGHRTRFALALNQMIAMIGFSKTQATAAAASAASALNAPGTSATSVTSLSVATGNQVLTLAQLGKSFALGQYVSISRTSAPSTNRMTGTITAFNAGTGAMTVNVDAATAAAGPFTDWTIALAASSGVSSIAGLTGTVTAAAAKTALGITVADITDYASDQLTKSNTLKGFAAAMAVALSN